MNSISSNLVTSLGTGSFKWERADGLTAKISRLALFRFLREEKVSFVEAASIAFFTAYFSYRKVALLDQKFAPRPSPREISIQTDTPPPSPKQISCGTQVEVKTRSLGTQVEKETRNFATQTDSPRKSEYPIWKAIASRVGNSAVDTTISAALTAALSAFH
jgi:hypothetical protein